MDDRDSRDRDDRTGGDRGPDRSGPRRGGSQGGRPSRDGDRRRGDGDRPRYNGDRPKQRGAGGQGGDRPHRSEDRPRRDGDRPRRDGDRPYRGSRDGERRYGDRPRRDGDRPRRDGERRDDKDRPRRESDRPYSSRSGGDGERRRNDRPRRDGDRAYGDRARRDGERPQREGDRKGYRHDGENRGGGIRSGGNRSGDKRSGGKPSYGRGGTRGGGRSDRGGQDREFTEAERLQHELRPVRAEHDDPIIPIEIEPADLPAAARNELKTLQPETAERVARHLAMVALLIDDDPELAHQHAISASRRAGRIPVARETLAATAYRIGDYALALRELRTHRRLSGSQGNLALMVEAERALGRPQKGLETGLEADTTALNAEQRAQLAIAMSGARLDLGQTQQALFELEIPELDPNRAYTYSPELFAAYAAVLEELGRDAEAQKWRHRAEIAEAALNERFAESDQLEVLEVYEHAPRGDQESEGAEPEPEPGAGAEDEAVSEAEAEPGDPEEAQPSDAGGSDEGEQ